MNLKYCKGTEVVSNKTIDNGSPGVFRKIYCLTGETLVIDLVKDNKFYHNWDYWVHPKDKSYMSFGVLENEITSIK